MTKFLLDSGHIDEYKEIAQLAKEKGSELWGATTNPSLIAKELGVEKYPRKKHLICKKNIVMQIVELVPGAVSAEVYADANTTAEQMIEQGREIGKWHERIVVKLPTTKEGFKARTALRKEGIEINNTLVFSLNKSMQSVSMRNYCNKNSTSATKRTHHLSLPLFLGRIDDRGEDGLSLLAQGISLINTLFTPDTTWLLSSSIRSLYHMKKTIELHCDIITAPAKVYREWFNTSDTTSIQAPEQTLKPIPAWEPTTELVAINSVDMFMAALNSGVIDISHPLTDTGIKKFTEDWEAIIL